MSDDSDPELDALRRQTSHGDRLDAAPRADERRDLQASIREALAAIASRDRQNTESAWAGDLAVLSALAVGSLTLGAYAVPDTD